MFDETTPWTELEKAEETGGRPALAHLLNELYGPPIKMFLKSRFNLLKVEEIEDISQGFYQDLLENKLNPNREKGRLRGLLGIYFNRKVSDLLKKTTRKNNALQDLSQQFNEYLDEEENRKKLDLLNELNEVIYELPQSYLIVIEYHYFDNLTCREIAEQINTNIEVVKTRLKRGRDKMKKLLDNQC